MFGCHSMHFFFLSIGREPTAWHVNNSLEIMVCLYVVSSKRVLPQIIFCTCVIGTMFSREKWQIASLSCQEFVRIWQQLGDQSNDKTIIELGYRKISWFVSASQLCQIIDLLATDKSPYFAHRPRPIIFNDLRARSICLLRHHKMKSKVLKKRLWLIKKNAHLTVLEWLRK